MLQHVQTSAGGSRARVSWWPPTSSSRRRIRGPALPIDLSFGVSIASPPWEGCVGLPPHAILGGQSNPHWGWSLLELFGTDACFTCGFRAITFNFHLPGKVCDFRVVSRRFSEICGSGRGSLT